MRIKTHRHTVTSRWFTLIELLVAIAILGLALAGTMTIIAEAQQDLIVSRDEWIVQHALTQATEFALLVNPQNLDIPSDILPPGFHAEAQLVNITEQLPEYAAQARQGWALGSYSIILYGPDGQMLDQNTIYKIVRETDL